MSDMEKTVVPWQNDSEVKHCPNCSKKFSMTYRRHHCRLCGKVICERCVGNLDMSLACRYFNVLNLYFYYARHTKNITNQRFFVMVIQSFHSCANKPINTYK